MPEMTTQSVHKHPEFFFSDGNIILITSAEPSLAYRLHRGIVDRWSPVFRGMLNALDVASDPWTLLDCGVLVFDDDPVDFERLIRVLCDGTSCVSCSPENFPLLASVLQLSHKYDIPYLQTLTLNNLLEAYPLTLSGWDSREAYTFSLSARHDRLRTLRSQRPHPLAIISLALRVRSPHLLVPAYLDLARFPVSDIIHGYTLVPPKSITTQSVSINDDAAACPADIPLSYPTLHLPILQTAAILRGKETLQRFIADFIKASIENRVQSPLCRYFQLDVTGDPFPIPQYPCAVAFARVSRELLVMTAGVSGGVDSDPLFVLRCAVEMLREGGAADTDMTLGTQDSQPAMEDDPEQDVLDDDAPGANGQPREDHAKDGACAACAESFKHTVDAARNHVWNYLPKWFDLRKLIEEGFEAGWE